MTFRGDTSKLLVVEFCNIPNEGCRKRKKLELHILRKQSYGILQNIMKLLIFKIPQSCKFVRLIKLKAKILFASRKLNIMTIASNRPEYVIIKNTMTSPAGSCIKKSIARK